MNQNTAISVIQSAWLDNILADPIGKSKLTKKNNVYYSENGFAYHIKDSVPDFRIRLNQFETGWQEGQDHYEQSMVRYLDRAEADDTLYPEEQKRDAPVYEKLPLEGRVLDVGGNLGAVRKYMTDPGAFCSVDPFINVYKLAAGRKNLFQHYPMHLPLNFVAGFAEFLPFVPSSFDTVNMRSCIDHFFNPELSLLEANRVLKDNGKLIIGMTVRVESISNLTRESARKVLNLFTKKFEDKHMWHPSKDELLLLCKRCGFEPEAEVWQNENVWYGAFRKNNNPAINIT